VGGRIRRSLAASAARSGGPISIRADSCSFVDRQFLEFGNNWVDCSLYVGYHLGVRNQRLETRNCKAGLEIRIRRAGFFPVRVEIAFSRGKKTGFREQEDLLVRILLVLYWQSDGGLETEVWPQMDTDRPDKMCEGTATARQFCRGEWKIDGARIISCFKTMRFGARGGRRERRCMYGGEVREGKGVRRFRRRGWSCPTSGRCRGH
jgi:hypothetical protein